MRSLCIILIAGLCLSSCISKKKYLETLASHAQSNVDYEDILALKELKIVDQDQTIDSLRIVNATHKGANEALLITQDRLQDRLDAVQDQVLAEQKSKSSTTQDMRSVLNDKEETIRQRDAKLEQLKNIIAKQANTHQRLLTDFTTKLSAYGADNYSLKIIGGELRISLVDNLVFRPSQTRVKTEGLSNLGLIAGVINDHPSLKIYVISNTDNAKVKGFTDNLEFSALRAANVVRVLTDDYGVSPNRVLAGGKGEYAPIASNQTREGRIENQRIDFIIESRMDRVVRELEKALAEEELEEK